MRSRRRHAPQGMLGTAGRAPVTCEPLPAAADEARWPRWIALHERVGGDVARHHRTGRDERELADGDAGHDDGAGADRRAATDVGRCEPGVAVVPAAGEP